MATLNDNQLKNCLEVILEQMQKQGLLNTITDEEKENILYTLIESFDEIFGREQTPQELFVNTQNNSMALRKIMNVACAIHLQQKLGLAADVSQTKTLATELLAGPIDENTKLAQLKIYNALFLELDNQLDNKQLFDLARKLKPQPNIPELKKEEENKEEAKNKEELDIPHGLTKEQETLLQMIGVPVAGLLVPIYYIVGNAIGASDTAINYGAGTTGSLHMDSENCQSLNILTRDQIAENLAAIGDITPIFEAIASEIQQRKILGQGQWPPRPSPLPMG